MNFVDGLGLEVLSSESFGLIVWRFGVTTWFCDAPFSPLKRFGGRTVVFVAHIAAIAVAITAVAGGDASA